MGYFVTPNPDFPEPCHRLILIATRSFMYKIMTLQFKSLTVGTVVDGRQASFIISEITNLVKQKIVGKSKNIQEAEGECRMA